MDLSNVLQPGDSFEVHNVQDYFGPPVIAGTYSGGTISIPMSAIQPPAPLGGSPSPPPITGPEFNAYVVTKQN